jgi:murein DD-endopeptidase MepM/ murein hydrolase activator NlpD
MYLKNVKPGIMRIIAVLCAAVLLLTVLTYTDAFAESEQEKKEKQLEEVKDKKDDVYGKIKKLRLKIEKQQAKIDKVQASIKKKQKQIKKTENSIEKMKRSIFVRKKGLDSRVRAMYKNGVIGFLDILLNSSDVTELITNIDMVQKIYKADQDTLDDLVEERHKIEAREAVLKTEKKELAETEDDLSARKKKLDADNKDLVKEYTKLQEKQEKLEAEIQEIIQANQVKTKDGVVILPGKYKGGKWICPVYGTYYVNSYGNYLAGRSYESHPGIDMAAHYGTPIHAACDGTVIKAGGYGGYGNVVMLSHGGGLVSLYGHNTSVSVSVGQKVKKGQVIASMGSTGWSTGPHCHFEVRQYSGGSYELRNPRDYCYIHGPNS